MAVAGGIVASGAIGVAGISSISTLFVEVVDDMAASDHWLEPSRGCALSSEVLECEPPPRRKEPKRDLVDALWGRAEWLTCPRLPFFHLQMAKAAPNRPASTFVAASYSETLQSAGPIHALWRAGAARSSLSFC